MLFKIKFFLITTIMIFLFYPSFSEDETPQVIKVEEAFKVPLKVSDVLTSQVEKNITPTETPEAVAAIIPTATPTPSPEDIQKQIDDEIKNKLEKVQNLLDRGRETEAKVILLDIPKKYPESKYAPQSLYLLGRIESSLPEAIGILNEVVLKYPQTVWAGLSLYKISEYYFFLGDYINSEINQKRYLDEKWDKQFREKAFRSLLAVQLKLNKFNDANSTLDQLWKEFPSLKNEPSILESYGEIQMELNKYTEAQSIFENIAKSHPSYQFISRIYLNKGFCAESLNQKDAAIKIYRDIIQLFPQSLEADLAQMRLNDIESPIITIVDKTQVTDSSTTGSTQTLNLNNITLIESENTTDSQQKIIPQKKYKSKDF